MNFRNLVEKGGPEFPEDAVKELAKGWPNKITDGPNDAGEMFEREPKLPDPMLGPFKNDKAGAAAFGVSPPDLSIMAKARNTHHESSWPRHVLIDMPKDIIAGYQEGGPDYIYAVLTGYVTPPAGKEVGAGLNYNAAFPGNQIAMPAPLAKDNFVKYQDGIGLARSQRQGCRGVPRLGGRPLAQFAQAHRLAGDAVSLGDDRAALSRQEADLVEGALKRRPE